MLPSAPTPPPPPIVLPTARAWAVAWTKARCEKALVEFLEAQSVPTFLPLLSKRRMYGRQVRYSQIPLFSGYVFFDYEAIPRLRVFESRKVAQILVPDDPSQLRLDLENLALALQKDDSLREARFGGPGTPVYVARGPLIGVHGELVRFESRSTLVIRVNFIGKAAELEIDEAFVEPIL